MPAEIWDIVLLSLRVAISCVLVSLLPGVVLGWILARYDFPLKTLVDGILHLPLVLPPVVTGYVLLLLFGRRGFFGPLLDTFGISLAFDWKGAVLASAVVGFPLLLRAVRLSIENIDPRLETAARSLGATRLRTFLTITLRLALPGLLAGALLTFARSLGEFGATIVFAGNIQDQTRTLPAAIYTYLNQPGGEDAALGLVLVSASISLLALVGSESLARRLRS